MKEQTELATALYGKRPETEPSEKKMRPSPEPGTDRRGTIMIALWKRLREYFGTTWTREHGDIDGSDIAAWRDGLEQYTEAQIARGVKWCQEWTNDFPPTLPQFLRMCLSVRPEELPNVTEKRMALEKDTGKPVAMLEHLARVAHSEIAKRELGRMRQIMDGVEVETLQESYHNFGLVRRWGRVDVATGELV